MSNLINLQMSRGDALTPCFSLLVTLSLLSVARGGMLVPCKFILNCFNVKDHPGEKERLGLIQVGILSPR